MGARREEQEDRRRVVAESGKARRETKGQGRRCIKKKTVTECGRVEDEEMEAQGRGAMGNMEGQIGVGASSQEPQKSEPRLPGSAFYPTHRRLAHRPRSHHVPVLVQGYLAAGHHTCGSQKMGGRHAEGSQWGPPSCAPLSRR